MKQISNKCYIPLNLIKIIKNEKKEKNNNKNLFKCA